MTWPLGLMAGSTTGSRVMGSMKSGRGFSSSTASPPQRFLYRWLRLTDDHLLVVQLVSSSSLKLSSSSSSPRFRLFPLLPAPPAGFLRGRPLSAAGGLRAALLDWGVSRKQTTAQCLVPVQPVIRGLDACNNARMTESDGLSSKVPYQCIHEKLWKGRLGRPSAVRLPDADYLFGGGLEASWPALRASRCWLPSQ